MKKKARALSVFWNAISAMEKELGNVYSMKCVVVGSPCTRLAAHEPIMRSG